MTKHLAILVIASVCSGMLAPPATAGDRVPIEVYLLGGQSNMQGLAKLADLPPAETKPLIGASYWDGKRFVELKPGDTLTSTRDDRFGPEIGFAARLLSKPAERKIYIVKHYRSGTGLDGGWHVSTWLGGKNGDGFGPRRSNFYPGVSSDDPNRGTAYIEMIARHKEALAALDRDRVNYIVKGVVWVQGEQDAKHRISAGRYARSLATFRTRLFEDLELSDKTIPFVYAQVLGMPDDVAPRRFGQRTSLRESMLHADADSKRTEAIPHTHMVSTNGLTLTDDVHYDARGQMMLGARLADSIDEANTGRRSSSR